VKFFVKLLLKAGITLGVMFIGYQYLLSGGSGGLQIPGMEAISDKASKGMSGIGNVVVEKDVTVYQWVDDKGVTHYGGTPPTGQGQYTKKEIHTNTNLLNAYQAPQQEESEETTQKSRVSRVGSVYSPEGVKEIIDDAKGVEKLLEDRANEQKKMLDNL